MAQELLDMAEELKIQAKKLEAANKRKEAADKKLEAEQLRTLYIVIYANWCHHCQDMIKRLGNLMKDYKQLRFLEEQQVDGKLREFYPRVIVYRDGEETEEGTIGQVYALLNS